MPIYMIVISEEVKFTCDIALKFQTCSYKQNLAIISVLQIV